MEQGTGWIILFSEFNLFECNVLTILSPIVVPFSVTVVINIVKVEYLTHVFFFFLSFSSLLPYFTALQHINNLETKRSYKREVNLKNLKFLKKSIERF